MKRMAMTGSRIGYASMLLLMHHLCFSLAAYAEDAEIDGVVYFYKDLDNPNDHSRKGECAIEKTSGDRAVLVPDERKILKVPLSINGLKVTKIGESAFRHLPDVEEIVLPDGIAEIERCAFRECWSLKKINIPSSVRYIGYSAFEECESLKSVTLPKNVRLGSWDLFKYCRSLETFEFPEGTSFVDPDGTVRHTLGVDCFAGCSSLRAIRIPLTVESICPGIFDGCEALSQVDLPSNLKTIGDFAFRGCKSLETIDVPESVVEIGDNAFNGCSRLKAVKLPYRIEKIEGGAATAGNEGAFANCTSLREIAIPENVTEIGRFAFRNCSSLQRVVFSPEIQRIRVRDGAFCGCSNLKEIVLPRGIEKSVLDAQIDTKQDSKRLRELSGLKITHND